MHVSIPSPPHWPFSFFQTLVDTQDRGFVNGKHSTEYVFFKSVQGEVSAFRVYFRSKHGGR